MKIAWNYLQQMFLTALDKAQVLERLTMTGLEVEADTPLAPAFSGVVVAEVVTCQPHPDADKLSVCQVNVGENELVQIICGASNVKAGVKVPCAKVGAVLPGDFKIASRKMRGLLSSGMLCSGDELGCPNGVDGLLILANDAPVGQDIREYLELNDSIVEFKITPNRGDCLSYTGLAREVAALTGAKLRPGYFLPTGGEINPLLQLADHLSVANTELSLSVTAPQACPHYCGLVIKGVENSQASPLWLARILERSGIRSISPIVDITNYVMLTLGQPMHAFDLNAVQGGIKVRMATLNEELVVLDNTTAKLNADTLVIANAQNQPLALAGVMGGLTSGVSAASRAIVLESAYFSREAIQGQAKRYALSSDSAYRFERGVDRNLQLQALQLAATLIQQICGGEVGEMLHFGGVKASPVASIKLSYAEIDAFIGAQIAPTQINAILTSLGCEVTADEHGIAVNAPSYRFDLMIKADIIEEIVRIYGYDRITAVMPKLTHSLCSPDPQLIKTQCSKVLLRNLGFNEVINYAFQEPKYVELLGDNSYSALKLQNPIAGLTTLRTNLVAGLIKNLQKNLNRGQERVRIFELARVFHGEEARQQPLHLAALVYGPALPVNWASSAREVDFFDLRLVVEELLATRGELTLVAKQCHHFCHPGRSAAIYLNQQPVGYIAQLHPGLAAELGLTKLPYLFELNWELIPVSSSPELKEISKFQKVSRDLAFVVEQNLPAALVSAAIKQLALPNLQEVQVFDVFSGGNLATNEKSLALNLLFQAQHTLTDDEINADLEQIKQTVNQHCKARLR